VHYWPTFGDMMGSLTIEEQVNLILEAELAGIAILTADEEDDTGP